MKRFIIILIALISSTLAFNQAVKAQNRIKVPVFESVVTAKNGSVNIRKEASTKSDKIGKIYANRRFYPLLEETDEWYCILLPATEDESQKKDGLVRCGYVSKTYSKAIAIDENLKDLSNLANYLETKMDCKESKRMEGDTGTISLFPEPFLNISMKKEDVLREKKEDLLVFHTMAL